MNIYGDDSHKYNYKHELQMYKLARIIVKDLERQPSLRVERDMAHVQGHRAEFQTCIALLRGAVNERILDNQERYGSFASYEGGWPDPTHDEIVACYRTILDKVKRFNLAPLIDENGPLANCWGMESFFRTDEAEDLDAVELEDNDEDSDENSDEAADPHTPVFGSGPVCEAVAIQWRRLNNLNSALVALEWVCTALGMFGPNAGVDTTDAHNAIYLEIDKAWRDMMTLALIADPHTRAIVTERRVTDNLISRGGIRRSLEHLTSYTGSYFTGDRKIAAELEQFVNEHFGDAEPKRLDVDEAMTS